MTTLALQDPEIFERHVWRCTAGAAVGGLVAAAAQGVGISPAPLLFPLIGAMVAVAAGRRRILMALLGAVAATASSITTTRPVFALVTAGAVAGLGFCLNRMLAGETPKLAAPSLGYTALASAFMLAIGAAAVAVFESRQILSFALPAPLASSASAGLMGFFLGLGGIALHLRRSGTPVEALYAELSPRLDGKLGRLAGQIMERYRRCLEALEKAPPGPAQKHLEESLGEVANRSLELARGWHSLDIDLGERTEVESEQRRGELVQLLSQCTDPSARRQLEITAAALDGERDRLGRIRQGRERVLARLHADLALLERTRLALIALRCSDTHLRAQIASSSTDLSTLGRELDEEAEAMDFALHDAMATVEVPRTMAEVTPVASEPQGSVEPAGAALPPLR